MIARVTIEIEFGELLISLGFENEAALSGVHAGCADRVQIQRFRREIPQGGRVMGLIV